MKKKLILLLLLSGIVSTVRSQSITAAEYFIDTDPGKGNGTSINIGAPGDIVNFSASIPTVSLSSGFHLVAIRIKDADGVWSHFDKRGFYLSTTTTDAGNITGAEYFFDADPGPGNGTALSIGAPGATVNFTVPIPAALSAGFHFLTIRLRDVDGKWSLFEKRGFYLSTATTDVANIVAAEYFFDTDPGVGNGAPASVGATGAVVNFSVAIPTALSEGFHFLAIRTKNADGKWSLFEKRGFYISTTTTDLPIITAAEFFIDSDPGPGNGTALTVTTPGTTVTESFTVPVPGNLSNGDHLLAIRVKNQTGSWSLFEARTFTVGGSVSISCPTNKTVAASQGQCNAVVTDIDPTVTPQGTGYDYTLSGATTGSGSGSASGQTFNVGLTTVVYKITSSPNTTCSFTVTVNGNAEVCNGIDDDCDGQVDEGVGATFYRDLDGDGFGSVTSGTIQACSVPQGYIANNTDCNDADAAVNPNTTWYLDADNDNYYTGSGVTQCTSPGAGYKMAGLTAGGDCNDANVAVHPNATEICNNIDDDCDGQTDEGAQLVTWYQDADGDGFGNPSVNQQSCTQPAGYVLNNTDCDDTNDAINPNTIWYLDADNDNYYTGSGVAQCTSPGTGYKMAGLTAGGDCNDANGSVHPNAVEICNNTDDDCDGLIDEAVKTTFYQDADGDGFGNPSVTQLACSAPQGYIANNTDCNDADAAVNPNTTWYLDADNDNYYTGSGVTQCTSPGAGYKKSALAGGGDCNDNNINVHPNAAEICNNIDDDCDWQIDEGAQPVTWYQDADGDGFGNPSVNQQSCTQLAGYVLNNADCDDTNNAINPNTIWYLDADNDNYYTGSGVSQCLSPAAGYRRTGLTGGGDCNDANESVHPNATEICNGMDDDCDGQVDEGAQLVTWYQDTDGDGFGNPSVNQQSCTQPLGYVLSNTDCDDTNNAINPNTVWYLDADSDNYYTGSGVIQCTSPGAGYRRTGLSGGSDCNDANASVYPNATEICNNIDDDCDGQIDEGAQAATWYQDADGDGFGNPSLTQLACSAPQGYVADNTDCNDADASVHPNATEICGNNIDDNCNDQTDENCTEDLPIITLRTYPVKEGNAGTTVFDVEVKLDRPAPLQIRINYATSNDDAIAGLDYVATQGVLTIPVGATSGTIPVSIIGDRLRENNERFWLNFTNPVNAIIEGDRRSRIMIIDDDKGKLNVRTELDIRREQLPGLSIPNVVSRNHIWTITAISEMKNEVIIMNMQGQVIFRANNYKNNIPIGNVATGLYVYQIRVMEKDKTMKYYTGKLFVTE